MPKSPKTPVPKQYTPAERRRLPELAPEAHLVSAGGGEQRCVVLAELGEPLRVRRGCDRPIAAEWAPVEIERPSVSGDHGDESGEAQLFDPAFCQSLGTLEHGVLPAAADARYRGLGGGPVPKGEVVHSTATTNTDPVALAEEAAAG